MDKDFILAEIRRTTQSNSGKALGQARFEAATGIRPTDVYRYWARWNDALEEAGAPPNQFFVGKIDDDEIIAPLVELVRRFGKMPTLRELAIQRREDPSVPSGQVLKRRGSKATLTRLVADYCREREDCADVLAIVEPLIEVADDADQEVGEEGEQGFVYMLKAGRYYKIGRTNSLGRRSGEIALQLPEEANHVHAIRTDDPSGIEAYWHRRFADRRKNGEWFELTVADVRAFKRRRFQ